MACKEREVPISSKKHDMPHLIQKGHTTQLIVDDAPFIVLGGELGNSSFTSVEYMESIWPKLKAMNLNTVLAPIYWELMEPEEGKFDFQLMDQLVDKAREHDLKLILLWFGSWKNSMSSHAPSWVKKDQERFPRIKDDEGNSHEILSPFGKNNLTADLKAYEALMQHIKELDGNEHTIIMVQTENEIGMLPSARDHHPMANEKFQQEVPEELLHYLKDRKEELVPEFYQVWGENGFKTTGTWEEVFGKGTRTDEIFMAWFYAKYTNAIVEAGKKIHPLPMYVNAALNRPNTQPGKGYPSAGPLPHIMDVWLAGGASIDFLSPDFYFPNIEHWCDLYTRQDNPLFIPEHRFDQTVSAKALFTIGHYESLGFSPFSIESTEQPGDEDLGKVYALVHQMTPLIGKHHGQGKIDGVLLDKEKQESTLNFGNYELMVRHSHTLGWEASSSNEKWAPAGAILVQTSENEFYVAGSGIVVTFNNLKDPSKTTGILKDEEGRFEEGQWKVVRHLNGDQTHQGRHVRIFLNDYSIQRFELYDYD
ncbi:mannonate dehydratase [Flagellimonas pelagia]|uniref:Mannonate dehydratase n=2 Tax=Flagellimonas pelagia TaxID=2306998 RepID=A0A3A1NLW1_9FLAO|nr:mannonate dehydratase [Allomuricauda maritima]TXJ99082.1 mannonate dehydratase [Allomuricauda maritima]